jgi:hypothetical protein
LHIVFWFSFRMLQHVERRTRPAASRDLKLANGTSHLADESNTDITGPAGRGANCLGVDGQHPQDFQHVGVRECARRPFAADDSHRR